MPRSASKSSGATSGKPPRRSSPRAVASPAPKRTAEFFHALAVLVLTLAAGLIAMWLTGGTLSQYGKSEVQIPAGTGDFYECTLHGSGTSYTTTGTSHNTAGTPTNHWYLFETYAAPCTGPSLATCSSNWGSIYQNATVGNPVPLPWNAVSSLGAGYWRLGSKMAMIDTTPVNYRCNDNSATDPVVQVTGGGSWSVAAFEALPLDASTFINGTGLTPDLHVRADKPLTMKVTFTKPPSTQLTYSLAANPTSCGGHGQSVTNTNMTNEFTVTPDFDGLCDWTATVTDGTTTIQRAITKVIDPYAEQPAAGQTIHDISNSNVTVHDNGSVSQVRACIEGSANCIPGVSGSGYVGQGFRTSGTTFSVHFNFFQNGVTCPVGQTSCPRAIRFELLQANNSLTGWPTTQTYTIVPQAAVPDTWGYQTSIGAGPSGQTCISDDTNPQHISALSDMDYGTFTVVATCAGDTAADCMDHGVVNMQVNMTDTLQTPSSVSWALTDTPMTRTTSGRTVTYTLNAPGINLAAFEIARQNPEKEYVIRYNAYSVNDNNPATGDQLFMKQHSCTVVRKISPDFSRVNIGSPSAGACSLTMEARDTGNLPIANATALTGRLVPAAVTDIVPVNLITNLSISPSSPFAFDTPGTKSFSVSSPTTQSVKFFGFATANGTEVRFFDTETVSFPTACLAAGTGVPSATNSTITATAGACTGTNRAGTVTVTVRDGQATPALVTGATVTLQAFATATSTPPLTDVTITPASVVTTATGVATFNVTVPSATASSVVFKATVTSTSNPNIVLTSAATAFGACINCVPTTCNAQGAECGSISNGCGGTLNCGTCTGSQTCQSNQCVDAFSCTGTVPANAALCAGDATGLTASVQNHLVAACSATNTNNADRCEYTCTTGFVLQGGACVTAPTFSCTGTAPANATLCSGDDQGLTADVARHLVASCSATNTNNADRCEYTCSTGFVQQGGACIPAAPTNLTCTVLSQTSLRGNWTAPQTGVQSFRVQLRQGSTVAQTATEPGTAGTHTFNGLTAAVTYTLGVAGLDAAGAAGVEATVQCTTTAPVTPGIVMAITESVGTPNDGRMLADGTSLATLTCTLQNYAPRSGQTDLNGYTVNFAHTDAQGQVGTLLATTATTNAAGVASVQVRAPSTSGVGDYTCTEPTAPTAASGVIVFSPVAPVDFQLALTVPLEGRQATRGGSHGTFATDAMEVRITGTAGSTFAAVTLTDVSTSDSGLVDETVSGVVVPDGTQLVVSFKTPQHIRRTVIGTVQNNALIINLANPATFQEVDTNLRKGKYFLPAGDLTGTKPGESLNDNKVDPSDIATWIAAFRDEMSCTNAVSTILEDLNGNCRVGAEDLSLIIRNMNDDGDPQAG